ncbi:hypothetical protein DFAR_3220006 [Desulfarculales bacterium]
MALRQALLKQGLPRKLYLDNGPAFRSHHLEEINASLHRSENRSWRSPRTARSNLPHHR